MSITVPCKDIMSNTSRLFYCTVILTCLLGQHVDNILTEGVDTCTVMMNSFKGTVNIA